jgi:hypothetical protein
MSSNGVGESLADFEKSLRFLLASVRKAKIRYVRRADIQVSAKGISTTWFQRFDPYLEGYDISAKTKEKYAGFFRRLLALSSKGSQSSSYISLIDQILSDFNDDISIPIWRSSSKGVSVSILYKMIAVATEEEKDYLQEALGCAKLSYLRAATILTWSATMHRIHKVVEKIGFPVVSQKSQEIKKNPSSRYKRFSSPFDVHSMTEMQLVFDNVLLWVMEYMQLIDGNQHDRLEICFMMRNNSGHPGEGKITEPNFHSFCSDVYEFVFANSKFNL